MDHNAREGVAARAAEADPAVVYGPEYYATHCGDLPYARTTTVWLEFYGRVADAILRGLSPRRVFDAGCAIGFLVEALWDRGVEAHGRDVSPFAISQVRQDVRPYCAVGSIAEPINGEYDLVLCIEVLEHMPEEEALQAIGAITAAAPRILFSSSPTDLDEPTHVNVRPTIYWLRRFAEVGFAPVPTHDATYLCAHAMLLERSAEGRTDRDLAASAEIVRQRLAVAELTRQAADLKRRAAEAARSSEADARARAEKALRSEIERSAAAVGAEAQKVVSAAARAAASEREADRARAETESAVAGGEWALTRMAFAAARAEAAEAHAAAVEAHLSAANARVADTEARLADAEALVVVEDARAAAAEARTSALETSTFWRATRPVRAMAHRFPSGRRAARWAVGAAWRTANLRLTRRLSEERRLNVAPAAVAAAPVAPTIGPEVAPPRLESTAVAQHVPAREPVAKAPPFFDADWYLKIHPDVTALGFEALPHYIKHGAREGRSPGPGFNAGWYAQRYPDVASSGLDALSHYLLYGRREGCHPVPPTAPRTEPERDYDRWVREYDTLTDDDRTAIRAHIGRLGRLPLISVVMPAYETSERLLREAVASVQAQLYPNWELCVADDASPSGTVAQVLREVAASDPRIKWIRRDVNGHISAATNSALALAKGEFVALMDHDDLIPEQALYEVAVELDARPDADLVFSDQDLLNAEGKRYTPYFKTGWNPDLMLGHNAVSHFGVYRRALVERVGGMRVGFEGSQDYDLALRIAAASDPARIRHIPAVLYHWRIMDEPASFSQTRLDRCVDAARRAIRDHLRALGGAAAAAEVLPAPALPSWSRVRWPLPDPAPRVSLIVPTRDRAEMLARCVAGLLHRTDYPDLELLIADNGSVEPETFAFFDRLRRDSRVRVLPMPGPFNYSALNNAAVREATGQVLVLVNNDIDVIEGGWLREMVSQALRPEVGAVGAKLLYADGTVQHGGVLLGMGSFDGGPGVAGHAGVRTAREEVGYFGSMALARNFGAVTAACMALRREVFDQIGGFDETNLPVSFNDVDLCLRIGERGLRMVWTPFAELYHLESVSRGSDASPENKERAAQECCYMRARWGEVLDADPFFNPNFAREGVYPTLAFPPRRVKPWRREV